MLVLDFIGGGGGVDYDNVKGNHSSVTFSCSSLWFLRMKCSHQEIKVNMRKKMFIYAG